MPDQAKKEGPPAQAPKPAKRRGAVVERCRRGFKPPALKSPTPAKNLKRAYAWLNERRAVVTILGKTWVLNLPDPADAEGKLSFSTFEDFKRRYANWSMGTEGEEGETESRKPADLWLLTPVRRTYSDVVLDPAETEDPDAYNLWNGFAVVARSGPWPTIEHHLREVICAGNEANYHWLLHWMARCVQRPDAQAEVAVILRGKKGTGKGMAARLLQRIFGPRHSFQASSQGDFLNRFNGHLSRTLFFFIDEAFWAGDKKSEGRLKAIITEDRITVEEKYQPKMMMRNRLKIMMASNEQWVVPATADERRFFVLDVSDRCKGDASYFKKLAEAVDGYEVEAFFAHLCGMGLSDFDHRNPPHTTGLNDQKLSNLPSFDAFWYDCLTTGRTVSFGWTSAVPGTLLYEEYKAGRRFGVPVTSAQVGRRLRELEHRAFNRKHSLRA